MSLIHKDLEFIIKTAVYILLSESPRKTPVMAFHRGNRASWYNFLLKAALMIS